MIRSGSAILECGDFGAALDSARPLACEMNPVTISCMTRRVLLYPGEEGFIVAEVPSLPGCISQGKTRDEAIANVREAISLHEEVLRERGEAVPDDRVELVGLVA